MEPVGLEVERCYVFFFFGNMVNSHERKPNTLIPNVIIASLAVATSNGFFELYTSLSIPDQRNDIAGSPRDEKRNTPKRRTAHEMTFKVVFIIKGTCVYSTLYIN